MSYLPGKFTWFEHVSNDLTKARAFYEPLFDWHVEAMPMGEKTYHLIHSSGEGNPGIGGFRTAAPGASSHWHSYLSVLDVDKSYAAAVKGGAKSLLPPTDFAPVGRGAALADPTGAGFSIWKDAEGDRPDVDKTADGDWYWNELWTQNVKAALAFYETVFGYSHDSMDMGAQGTYYLLKTLDGKLRGGVTAASEPSAPPMWLPYVHVADCDATAKKAQKLGARQVIVPPTDIPGVGRFSILIDSLGAAIAVIKSVPAGG